MKYLTTIYNVKVNGILSGIAFVLSGLFGGVDQLFITLVYMIVIDILLGLIYSFKESVFKSRIMYEGIIRKVVMFIMIALAVRIDITTNQHVIRDTVVMFYIANEGLSIVENCILLGVPFPDFIKKLFAEWKEKTNNGGESDEKIS